MNCHEYIFRIAPFFWKDLSPLPRTIHPVSHCLSIIVKQLNANLTPERFSRSVRNAETIRNSKQA